VSTKWNAFQHPQPPAKRLCIENEQPFGYCCLHVFGLWRLGSKRNLDFDGGCASRSGTPGIGGAKRLLCGFFVATRCWSQLKHIYLTSITRRIRIVCLHGDNHNAPLFVSSGMLCSGETVLVDRSYVGDKPKDKRVVRSPKPKGGCGVVDRDAAVIVMPRNKNFGSRTGPRCGRRY